MHNRSDLQDNASDLEPIPERDLQIHAVLFDQIKFINYISVLALSAIAFVLEHGKKTPSDSLTIISWVAFFYGLIQLCIILPLIKRYKKATIPLFGESMKGLCWLSFFAGGLAVSVSLLLFLTHLIHSLPILTPLSWETPIFPNSTPLIAFIIVIACYLMLYFLNKRLGVEFSFLDLSKKCFIYIFTFSVFFFAVKFNPENPKQAMESLPLILWSNAWVLMMISIVFSKL